MWWHLELEVFEGSPSGRHCQILGVALVDSFYSNCINTWVSCVLCSFFHRGGIMGTVWMLVLLAVQVCVAQVVDNVALSYPPPAETRRTGWRGLPRVLLLKSTLTFFFKSNTSFDFIDTHSSDNSCRTGAGRDIFHTPQLLWGDADGSSPLKYNISSMKHNSQKKGCTVKCWL